MGGKLVKDLKVNPRNPRKITSTRLDQLGKSMDRYGDISGIVFNVRSGNLACGHQRSGNFNGTSKVVYTKKLDKPDKYGTVAYGYILHEGARFNYREVDWDLDTELGAMLAANKNAGNWDDDKLISNLKHLSSFDVDFDLGLTMFEDEELSALGLSNTTTVSEHERNLNGGDIDDEESDPEPPEEPNKLLGRIQLFNSDNLEVLKTFPENSIDSIVTDPPYGWRFMGKAWDGEDIEKRSKMNFENRSFLGSDGLKRKRNEVRIAQSAGLYDTTLTGNQSFQKFSEDWAREALRVLKPGGYIIVFCGPRTYHRMACGVEDAGFEVRDQLQWLFGSGFPKSLNISKAIDDNAGVEREVIASKGFTNDIRGNASNGRGVSGPNKNTKPIETFLTAPATEAAKSWEGWGTALKPANEPILLARKPLSEKTVAANVLKWGTGGLNIDASRIEGVTSGSDKASPSYGTMGVFKEERTPGPQKINNTGRFPANLILDETAAEMLDEQSGHIASGYRANYSTQSGSNFQSNKGAGERGYKDSGGASRFFYVAKASKSERNTGLEGMPKKFLGTSNHGQENPISGRLGANPLARQMPVANNHPTVKPTSLMRYLVRMVTPPNGIVLDLFMGSGSTGVAALQLGFPFIGIEKEKEYFKICLKRLNAKVNQDDRLVPGSPRRTLIRKKTQNSL